MQALLGLQFFEVFGIGFKKIVFQKRVSVSVSENMVWGKSLGFGIGKVGRKIWLQFWFPKILSGQKNQNNKKKTNKN